MLCHHLADSFLNIGSPAHFFSATGRFLRGCRKYGLIFSGNLRDDGMFSPDTGSEVAIHMAWEDIRGSVCSVH